jgi:hypothetical protein
MSAMHTGDLQRVVWPRGRRMVEALDLARRRPTLEGQTVAMLWDYVFRGDEIFPIVQEELSRRFAGMRFVPYSEFGATFGGDEHRTVAEIAAKLARHGVDAVVSGMGC